MSEEQKSLPKEVTAPNYPGDKLFFTLDGKMYEKYVKSGDKFVPSGELWDVYQPDFEKEQATDETMIFDPQETKFVFLRKRT